MSRTRTLPVQLHTDELRDRASGPGPTFYASVPLLVRLTPAQQEVVAAKATLHGRTPREHLEHMIEASVANWSHP